MISPDQPLLMLDLEGWGPAPDGIISTVGICNFRLNGHEYDKRNFQIDVRELENYGRKADPDTILWWFKQGPEALAGQSTEERESFFSVHAQLEALMETHLLLAQPVAYDVVLYNYTAMALGLKPLPWRRCFDVVSIIQGWQLINPEENLLKLYRKKRETIRENLGLVHHDAADDCVAQALALRCMYQEAARRGAAG